MSEPFVLCSISQRAAEHLVGAPAAIGGWIAVDDVVRYVAEDALGHGHLLAYIPAEWPEATQRVSPESIAAIVARLDGTRYAPDRALAVLWAQKIRAACAIAGVSDDQISALRTEAAAAGDLDQVALCALALDGSIWPDDHRDISTAMAERLSTMTQDQARAACAVVIAQAAAQS